METNNPFTEQVRLLVSLLPSVAKQSCFALKGGTAINLFVRDMPRLSVDIDLAYLPLEDRDTSLAGIDTALGEITADIERHIPRAEVNASVLKGTGKRLKLLVRQGDTNVKIEVSPVLRGSVYPATKRQLSARAEKAFGFARMPVLSFEDLYGGKICAALDRQHPRDLFDVHLLLKSEGLTSETRKAFVVYLVSHPRPMVEILSPQQKDISEIFEKEFKDMIAEDIASELLETTRDELVAIIRKELTSDERRFIVSITQGQPVL